MNIWDWVYDKEVELRDAGHEKLAQYIDQITEDIFDDKHEAVDLYISEAIQLARDIKEPWVEVFLRHWYLQSKVLHRKQPKGLLREAVELLEFSHRPENIDCPQSVCVVQDLTNCYGAADGPGYSKERMDVCTETLSRITPRWSCFECVSIEYVSALYDNGQYEEALEKLNSVSSQLEQVGHHELSIELELMRAKVLIRVGELDIAKRILKRIDTAEQCVLYRSQAQVYMALVSANEGDCESALIQLPAFDQIKRQGSFHLSWVDVVNVCVSEKGVMVKKDRLDDCMRSLMYAEERGAYRDALCMGAMILPIFESAGDVDSAFEALKIMKRVQPRLHVDLGASQLISEASARIQAA